MDIKIRHIGYFKGASSIIELIINNNGAEIIADVTNLSSQVDENLIQSLREIADELEEQNNKLINNKKDEQTINRIN